MSTRIKSVICNHAAHDIHHDYELSIEANSAAMGVSLKIEHKNDEQKPKKAIREIDMPIEFFEEFVELWMNEFPDKYRSLKPSDFKTEAE